MISVFIVMLVVDNEGEEIVAVFKNPEEANNYAERAMANRAPGNVHNVHYEFEEWPVL